MESSVITQVQKEDVQVSPKTGEFAFSQSVRVFDFVLLHSGPPAPAASGCLSCLFSGR